MKRKRTTAAEANAPLRVVLITLDNHVNGAWSRAADALSDQVSALRVSSHAATEWDRDPAALESALSAISEGDIVIVTMLFLDENPKNIFSIDEKLKTGVYIVKATSNMHSYSRRICITN